MTSNKYLATSLSILVPGLGQIYSGKSERGIIILTIVMIIGNLNTIWLSLHAIAKQGSTNFYGNEFPLLIHDILGTYGIIFLIWQVIDVWNITSSKNSDVSSR